MRTARYWLRAALATGALAAGVMVFAPAGTYSPVGEAEAACGFLGLYPCAPSGGGTSNGGSATGCGFLGLSACAAPPAGTPSSGGATVACGFLGLSKCPAPATPPSPDPGGSEDGLSIPPPGDRLFGFNTALSLDMDTDAEHEVGLGRAVGANAQRYAIHWRPLQKTQSAPPLPTGGRPLGDRPDDSYMWHYDALYLELVEHGMTPIILMIDAPAWASKYATCLPIDLTCMSKQKSTRLYPDAAHLADFKRFVTAVAERYPKAVIETWNEPNIKSFWGNDPPDPVQMAKMQCAAYQGVKALPQPNAVISPGIAVYTRPRADGSPLYETYLKTMYQHGLEGCQDGLNTHMYTANQTNIGEGSMFAEGWAVTRKLRTEFGDDSPVWVTETGTPSSKGAATDNTTGLTVQQQADVNNRLYNRLMTIPEVKAVTFHTLRNGPTPDLKNQPAKMSYHYGFLNENWSVKPVWCVFVAKAGKTYAGC